ncbi:hypothetical protein [Pseudoalteromonas byunsanensis]|uniref:Uncharacterized protein n=1 Tax=Pseudoalteromonas byunsanensis TaxID=327939 RepID=A0A1S1NDM7_9GAMM|nr:hypothetical protein [Pseudoalteromonas byunsanensis]OHU96463.1 hypothetical protein BIW53_03805 [Pseudoalteromonas byunsanensis]
MLTRLLILSLTLFSFTASAYYEHYVQQWRAKGTISVGNYSYTKYHPNLLRITKKAKQIRAVEDRIRAELLTKIRNKLSGKASLKAYDFKINGPFKIKLQGLSNGEIKATIGGFSVDAYAKAEKSFYAKARIKIWSNTLWATGYYNPYTGIVNRVEVSPNFKVQSDVDVDSLLDLIPLFNSVFTNSVEDDIEQLIEGTIVGIINSKTSSYEKVLFGMDQYVPDGTYVYNGKDYGIAIKDKFATLTSGEFIELTVDRTKKVLYGSREQIYLGNVYLNISNHIRLKVVDDPIIGERCDYSRPIPCSI